MSKFLVARPFPIHVPEDGLNVTIQMSPGVFSEIKVIREITAFEAQLAYEGFYKEIQIAWACQPSLKTLHYFEAENVCQEETKEPTTNTAGGSKEFVN